MTVQEAIKYLRMATDEAEEGEFSDEYREMCEMSIKALEKQIPKKLSLKNGLYHCSSCGMPVLSHTSYCSECGNKIDWEEGGTSD